MSARYCPYCRAELPAGATFCPYCGANVAEKPPVEVTKPPTPVVAPPSAPTPAPVAGTAVATIQDAIRRRSESDIKMSGAWILVVIFSPVLLAIGIFMVLIGFFAPVLLLIGGLVAIIALVLAAVLYYKLINRRNKHFMRSRMLREGLIRHIESKASELGRTQDVMSELSTMRMVHSELNSEEGDKSAGLYAILSIIVPFVSLYVMYFLTKEFVSHDTKERAFFQALSTAANKLGIPAQFPYWKELPRRSAGLYLILTIVLSGLFAIYWMWTLIKDPHQHFDAHAVFEDALMSTLYR
jgi:multisubunit Na+/H+ antiporter MnhB subunit